MNNVQLMAAISINAGVAVGLARDNVEACLRNGERLTAEEVGRIHEIKERLKEANAAALELERRANVANIESADRFWQAEQFQLFGSAATPPLAGSVAGMPACQPELLELAS